MAGLVCPGMGSGGSASLRFGGTDEGVRPYMSC